MFIYLFLVTNRYSYNRGVSARRASTSTVARELLAHSYSMCVQKGHVIVEHGSGNISICTVVYIIHGTSLMVTIGNSSMIPLLPIPSDGVKM